VPIENLEFSLSRQSGTPFNHLSRLRNCFFAGVSFCIEVSMTILAAWLILVGLFLCLDVVRGCERDFGSRRDFGCCFLWVFLSAAG
jgi:hypothetical protein